MVTSLGRALITLLLLASSVPRITAQPQALAPRQDDRATLLRELRDLSLLHRDGALDEDEYSQLKKQCVQTLLQGPATSARHTQVDQLLTTHSSSSKSTSPRRSTTSGWDCITYPPGCRQAGGACYHQPDGALRGNECENTTTVYLGLTTIKSIDSISDAKRQFTVTMSLTMSWLDPIKEQHLETHKK